MKDIEALKSNGLKYDATSPDEVRSLFESTFNNKSFNPLENPGATEALRAQIEQWRHEGSTVVFVCGVYDLFHANHRTYLMHAKIAAAPHVWNSSIKLVDRMPNWEELDTSTRSEFTRDLLQQNLLKLVVSVDGNMQVATNKGFNPEKGNGKRPIYDWTTRARDVLSAGYEIVDQPKLIVDAVTIHDKIQPELANTPHRSTMAIAEFVNADVWCLYDEATQDIEAVQTSHKNNLNGTEVVILSGHNFYSDSLLESPFSTTSILGRIATNGSLNGKNGKH